MNLPFDDQEFASGEAAAAVVSNRVVPLAPVVRANRIVGLAIFNDAQILDVAAVLEIFRSANAELSERGQLRPFEQAYRVFVFGANRGANRTSSGLHIVATHEYAEMPRLRLDTLVVVGGLGANPRCPSDLVHFVGRAAGGARRIAGMGSGAFVLAQANLLRSRRVTTHWKVREHFAKRYPEIHLEPDRLLVKDANIYTAAGGVTSLNLCLSLVEEDFGAEVAAAVASRKILTRPANEESRSDEAISYSRSASSRIRALAKWVMQNPRREFSIELLASQAAMSVRTLSRLFRRELGISPSKFVENVRLQVARRLLVDSDLAMHLVAAQSGFGTEDRMRRAFRRAHGKTPRQYAAMREVSAGFRSSS
jgi:transcriptional regulator GlxA family with amidase domain